MYRGRGGRTHARVIHICVMTHSYVSHSYMYHDSFVCNTGAKAQLSQETMQGEEYLENALSGQQQRKQVFKCVRVCMCVRGVAVFFG